MIPFTTNTYIMSNGSPTVFFSFLCKFLFYLHSVFSYTQKMRNRSYEKVNIRPERSLMSGLRCEKYKISKNNKCANFKLSDTCSLGM